MKKTIPTKKLTLNTLTVAKLSAVQGGLMAYTKHSVCMDQCCASDYCAGSTGC
jgi:hypothetical protein